MKFRYSKFRPARISTSLDLEELLSKLSDLLLRAASTIPYGLPYDDQEGMSVQALHDAILEALLNGGVLSDETLEKLLGKDWQTADDAEERIEQLMQQILEKLQQQGYLTAPARHARPSAPSATAGPRRRRAPSRTSSSRSPTRAWTSSAIARCATCSARSAGAASAGTTRARWPPGSRPAARRSRTSSATR